MRSFLFGLCSLLLPACAPTAHARLGDVARYAPGYAGYVVGDDDPVVLRDPITSEKIRCREDLERVAPAVAAALDVEVHDRYWFKASAALLAPFTAAGYASQAMGVGLFYPFLAIVERLTSPGRRELYAEAREAFLAGRAERARELFLAVIVGGTGLFELPRPWIERSVYYLGLSDETLHRDAEARDAFRRFLGTAASEDPVRYADAERRLARLEGNPAGCRSRADFTFTRRSP